MRTLILTEVWPAVQEDTDNTRWGRAVSAFNRESTSVL